MTIGCFVCMCAERWDNDSSFLLIRICLFKLCKGTWFVERGNKSFDFADLTLLLNVPYNRTLAYTHFCVQDFE